jgi:hypothetical protein
MQMPPPSICALVRNVLSCSQPGGLELRDGAVLAYVGHVVGVLVPDAAGLDPAVQGVADDLDGGRAPHQRAVVVDGRVPQDHLESAIAVEVGHRRGRVGTRDLASQVSTAGLSRSTAVSGFATAPAARDNPA